MTSTRLRTFAAWFAAAAVTFALAVMTGARVAYANPECPLVLTGFPEGIYAERFVLVDFDHDGILDVVATQPNVPFGNGGAVFVKGSHVNGYSLGTPVHIATGDFLEVVSSDFDRDGNADIALLDHVNKKVRVMRGLGNGTFAAPVLYSTEDDPVGLALGDVNRDGIVDLMIANGGTSPQLLMGNGVKGVGDGTFTSRIGPYTPYHAVSMFAADFDLDGIADIAVEEQTDTSVAIFRGQGTNGKWSGDWDDPVRYKLHDQPTFVRALDIDGDGILDLVCGTYSGGSTVLLGVSGLTFRVDSLLGDAHVKAPFGVANWLHDGRKSLVIADPGETTLRLETVDTPVPFSFDYLSQRTDTFGKTIAVICADLDGDGVDDAIAVSRDAQMFSVLLSNCDPLGPLQAPGAGWVTDGVPLTSTTGAKSAPQAASDGHGGAYVTWSDGGSSPAHVIVQHVLPDGRRDPAWSEGGAVVLPRSSAATSPQILSTGGGGAWVLWDEAPAAGRGLYAAPVQSDGRVPVWWAQYGFADTPAGYALAGSFAAHSDGSRGWVQAWAASGGDARAQRYTGTRAAFLPQDSVGVVVGTAATQRSEMAALPDGGMGIYTFWRVQDNAIPDVSLKLKRTHAGGSAAAGWPAGGLTLVSGAFDRHLLDMAGDGSGGVWVLWNDTRTGVSRLAAQHVDSAGVFQGPAGGIAISTLAGAQTAARLVTLPGGAAMVVFVHDGGDGGDIMTQVLAGGGLAGGTTATGRAVCAAGGAQTLPVVIADSLGGAFVAWQDHRGADLDVYATRVDSAGTPVAGWPVNGSVVCGASGDQSSAQLVTLGSGQAMVVWNDARSGVSKPYAMRLSPLAPVTGVASGAAPSMLLASVSPNPSHGRFAIRFSLPRAGAATLDLLDIAGRRVAHHDLGTRAMGEQEWSTSGTFLRPGVYLARLTSAGETRTARFVVLE